MLVRNYRPDGTLFWNESVIQPVRDTARQAHALHRLSPRCQRAAEDAPSARQPGLPPWLREDRLTGLHSRAYFEELLQRDWQLAQRDSHEIGLMLFDIDDLGAYNEKFDRSAGDACIRRVARVIGASYRRGGDLVGRWEGGTFAVLTQGEAAEQGLASTPRSWRQRVRDLLMHHPTAGAGRYVTDQRRRGEPGAAAHAALEGLLKACRAGAEARQEERQGRHRQRRSARLQLKPGGDFLRLRVPRSAQRQRHLRPTRVPGTSLL